MLKHCQFLLLSCLLLNSNNLVAKQSKELVFLNWTSYIAPNVVKKFEDKFKVKVRIIEFEDDEARDKLLLESKKPLYDLAIIDGTRIKSYQQRGWLTSITHKQVINLKDIEQRWKDAFPASNGYAVPYFWGTLGIAYRKDKVPALFEHWIDIFEPKGALKSLLKGKIIIPKSGRDSIGAALKALGSSWNSQSPKELKQAHKLLLKQRPLLHAYGYPELDKSSNLLNGKVLAAIMYNGDALMLKDLSPNIAFSIPQEGTSLWVDYLVVFKSSEKKQLAFDFIKFLNSPKIAAENAEYVHFATPNKQAYLHLSQAMKNDKYVYPEQRILNKSVFQKRLPPRVIRRYYLIMADLLQ